MDQKPKDPLHGKTLEAIINALVAYFGWAELGYRIRINCFLDNPSVNSSLKFLRKTPWARKKVEDLYIQYHQEINKNERQ
ncbi:VF530 family protein [Mucilaginibacter pedocola]|uniref:Transporter n=1 Tax=Mucilaginibacter pedocola TaxID=1792845 RepID=A0A1S9PJQ0_9SPHI|nr:VF530 family protein [Mucilaginibacter pedocola]OOQ60818.1 hypothetical protein BC343_22875 [Mucilaginibacter pedocola]